jgi:predicted  nucleic acid-binding Zn-ribbon protein
MAEIPSLQLNRLRVIWRGIPVYDQSFHQGVNIIRGENGSGKSTIADFIFYVVGGEFEDWKDAASRCDEVQAEIETPRGKLTLRRTIGRRTTPVNLYFGAMEKAEEHALDGWEAFPIRRQETQESLSQVLFRSMLIPEAQSEGASNITMHQVMRLMYSDQRTPSTRLFRFEPFDTQNIREAVGDLVCGISGYEIYEINLKLRDLENEFDELSRRLSALIKALPADDRLNNPTVIQSHIKGLENERVSLTEEIKQVDDLIDQNETSDFLKERKSAYDNLVRERRKISELEFAINTNELELAELWEFLQYLVDLVEKVGLAEKTQQAVGGIEFTQCPACLSDLTPAPDPHTCIVCGAPTNPDEDRSRYNQIRLDLEIQMRESRQLVDEKTIALNKAKTDLRALNRTYSQNLSEFSIKYDVSTSPRESFLASRNQRLGQIDREIEYFTRSLDAAEEIQRLSDRKGELQEDIQKLKDRREAMTTRANLRRKIALTAISEIVSMLLRSDLDRQPEFKGAQSAKLDFRDDALFVDGKMNFAESSNVYLKNSAIFGMFLAAGRDDKFLHPRFLLLDNIEDKGMEVERSHLFQSLIVEHATELKGPYQVIFTTSMMNPELELDDYVIGPHYTHEKRTLEFPS